MNLLLRAPDIDIASPDFGIVGPDFEIVGPDFDIAALDLDVVRQGVIAANTMQAALSRALDPASWRQRAQEAMKWAQTGRQLRGTGGQQADQGGQAQRDIEAVREAVARLPEGRLDAAPVSREQVAALRQVAASVTTLEEATGAAITTATALTDIPRPEAQRTGDSEILASAARALLEHTGARQDDLSARLDQAAGQAGIEDVVAEVLTAANGKLDRRARSVTDSIAAMEQELGERQASLTSALADARTLALRYQGVEPRPATFAGVAAVSLGLRRWPTRRPRSCGRSTRLPAGCGRARLVPWRWLGQRGPCLSTSVGKPRPISGLVGRRWTIT